MNLRKECALMSNSHTERARAIRFRCARVAHYLSTEFVFDMCSG